MIAMMPTRMHPTKKLLLATCYWAAPLSTALAPGSIGGTRGQRCFFRQKEQGGYFFSSSARFLSEIASVTSGSPAIKSQKPTPTNDTELQMLSFYHFEPLTDLLACRDSLFESLHVIPGLRGTIYLASEGVNAQMAVPPGKDLESLIGILSTHMPWDPFQENPPNFGDIVPIETPTFDRLIVRIRDFVLRDGIPAEIGESLDWTDSGPELSPEEWLDEVVNDNGDAAVTLLDCRNGYESDQGTFERAIPLETDTFQQSWNQIDQLTKELPRDEPLMIFCTGGIRCVKVGAYLKQHLGFSNVKRLQHGIIGYQQWADRNVGEEASVWKGENFLFDKRRFGEEEEEKEVPTD